MSPVNALRTNTARLAKSSLNTSILNQGWGNSGSSWNAVRRDVV
ncbi:hypothetical protein [Desulforhopalus vacuolatus]|nr:hypothetical protein [Desulforhopalus vacuolatus]